MARMNDRGQILLIGALVMAATFISLGVVLNGSLHTPSIAAKASGDVTGNQFAGVEDTTRREVAGLMEIARSKYPNDFDDQEEFVEQNVTALGNNLSPYYAIQDQSLSFTSVDAVEGRDLSAAVDADSSTPAPPSASFSTTEARQFVLETTSPLNGDLVVEVDGGTTHTITIDDSELTVDGSAPCSYSNKIEIMNASTDQEHCAPLEFVKDLNPDYDIDISTSSLSSGSVDYALLYKSDTGAGTELVYEVVVSISHYTTSMNFEGTIDVAPGEP